MPPFHPPIHRQWRPRSRLASLTRGKHVLVAIALCLTIFYVVSRSGDPSESTLLERHMNSGPPRYPINVIKSSVDWGNIEYRHPPSATLAQLPKPPRKGKGKLPRVQHKFKKESAAARATREARREAVLKLTKKCWDSYRRYAWMQDALLPLSKGGTQQFSGWAATLVDSLDTLWIMGLRDEFDEAVAAVAEIDFGSSTSPRVNIFETNIRYLGGLMAAYDLSGREVLLQKAVELGDLIYGGFNTMDRMPVDNINFEAAKEGTGLLMEPHVVSASPGTLTLELTRLSQITGDPKYYDAITGIVDLFYRGQNQTVVPGLFPMFVSMAHLDVTAGNTFTLGGCADSLYEYFPKMHALLLGGHAQIATLTRGFLDAAKRNLFFRPMVPDFTSPEADILISGNLNFDRDGNARLDPETEHLTCFIGGTFALAGRLFQNENDVAVGARLARGCVYAYRAFPTGMMPERLNMVPCGSGAGGEGNNGYDHIGAGPCAWDEDLWVQETGKRREYRPHLPKGFTTAKDPRYILRPEAIESVFYLWRITGETEWQEAAWDMFRAVARGTATETGSAAVLDVTEDRPDLPLDDYMEVSLCCCLLTAPYRTRKNHSVIMDFDD